MNKPTTPTSDKNSTDLGIGISMTTLIHIAVELIINAALAYWIYSRTSKLQEEIKELKEKLNTYEDVIKNQGQYIAKHENALAQIFAILVPQKTGPGATEIGSGVARTNPHQQPENKGQFHKQPNTKKMRPKVEEVEEGELDTTNIDDLLSEEYAELKSKHKSGQFSSKHKGSEDSSNIKDKSTGNDKKKLKKT
jgi:hypothetical protein